MRENEKLHQLVMAAIFAAAIAVTTAYILHIPLPTGGYVHLGDALIYLAACLLPAPWAMAAGAVGAGLADLLTAPMWVLPTLIVKALVCLPFTSKSQRVLCGRNIAAIFISGLLSPALYGVANVIFTGTAAAFLPQFLGTLVQAVGSGLVFAVLAYGVDRVGLKKRMLAV
ncbi:TIGR04002 family protein [Pseudoflavonifractor phocaeensis]|uniref:TIGR04002 family protein n=1 Tax=Pseudoflavonifractor phocaeensis TaxID=1870988 RepID=UPI00313A98E3